MNITQKNDKETLQLIADCIAQKRKAQHHLFKRFHSSLLSVCLRYAQNYDEAQDMLSEGFIKIFANLEKYQDNGSFEAWLKRVMANAALDFQRKYKTLDYNIPYEYVNEGDINVKVENSALSKISYDELMEAIQQIAPMSRNVFNLYIFEGYNHAEIAEMLNIKEGTSHWHLNFARNKLKSIILNKN